MLQEPSPQKEERGGKRLVEQSNLNHSFIIVGNEHDGKAIENLKASMLEIKNKV